MKRDDDKVVMVYTVEINDTMTPKQWLHGEWRQKAETFTLLV